MNARQITAALIISAMSITGAHAGTREDAVLAVINTYRPGSTGYGNMSVKKVSIDPATKTIKVVCNDKTAYLPLTAERMTQLKNDIRAALGSHYNNYKISIIADGQDLDALVLFSPKRLNGPTETETFVTRLNEPRAPMGLDSVNIALWQSHGWYFEPKLNRWEWQRARVMQTVEDLYTQSYVMPFLMPMLENAGAYVMSPRERDINPVEIIIDRDNDATPGYSEHNGDRRWEDALTPGFAWDGSPLHNGSHPFRAGHGRRVMTTDSHSSDDISTARWSADIPATDTYAVYVSYTPDKDASTAARYTIHTAGGDRDFTVNQQMGAGTWIYLGHFPLEAGRQTVVTLSNADSSAGRYVSADAVKIGGGYNVVERIVKEPLDSIDYRYVGSGYPKWTEGARYFLQWAGAPDSVFTPTGYINDYTDDYRSRGLWVNWLAGGSSMLPGREGLNIPIDLSFAFHSDAGTFADDSIVGTLGIYCTAGDTLGNGSERRASRDLTDLVMTSIVDDVRASFEPSWTRRGMWDQSYYEARVPAVPAMLLELLSHQNFGDMKYGLDPAFRFTVSRAIYKGMLRFLAHRDGRPYVVQPLPVKNFAITATGGRSYRLSWAETVDTLEATAHPTYYIIEERVGDSPAFTRLATVDQPYYDLTVSDKEIHSYRIIACNDGGRAFPGEVLALCDLDNGETPVLVVNGFTRVSGPDWFEASPQIAGFYDQRDHGVPYVYDIAYIGSQFEYRRDIPWMDDDAAGFGASRADFEDKVVAGNTFDYVYTHGAAIVAAGHPFISTSVGAYIDTPVEQDIKVVDLILGKQKEIKQGRGMYGTRFKTFPGELQQKIAAATATGTSFMVSGAFVATDLWDNPNSSPETAAADRAFATGVLGYHWRVGQASVTGEAYQVPCRFKEFTGGSYEFSARLNSECYAVESPDSFYAPDASRGCTLLRYDENNLVAGTACAFDNYRTVVIGFPFETIYGSDARASLMTQILNFLNK